MLSIVLLFTLVCVSAELYKIKGIGAAKLDFVSSLPTGEGHRFYVQINNKNPQTKDGYTLATVREGGSRNENFTHLSARTEQGKLSYSQHLFILTTCIHAHNPIV